MLSKKDRADVTRNALGGYQRFRFLFSLPGTMEKSIQKEEFDQAINDYGRAKTLFQQPELDKPVRMVLFFPIFETSLQCQPPILFVQIFRKFQKEVESRVEKLRETLRKKLLQKPPNAEEQRIVLEYLKTLECSGDMGWDCLNCHYEFISSSMINCFNQFASSDSTKDIVRTSANQEPQSVRIVNQKMRIHNSNLN